MYNCWCVFSINIYIYIYLNKVTYKTRYILEHNLSTQMVTLVFLIFNTSFPKRATTLKGRTVKVAKKTAAVPLPSAAVTLLAGRDVGHGGGPPPPPSAGARAVPAVPCAYPPLLLAVHLYPDPTPPAQLLLTSLPPNSQTLSSFAGQMGWLVTGASLRAGSL